MSLGQALQSLADRLDSRSGGRLSQTQAARAWETVSGKAVAAHTTGFFIRDGEAVVYVDNNVWATELSALSGLYMQKINEILGQETVKSMRFVVSRKVSEDKAFETAEQELVRDPREDMTETVPLSDAEMAQIRAAAAVVKDTDLREAAVRATKADLEWKKGQEANKNREKARDGL